MSDHAISNARNWLASIKEMVADLRNGDDENDTAREAIEQSALSVRVRGGWYSPAGDGDRGKPEEYEILLSTGGPALRLVGRLSEYGEPETANLEWQDWGTPWTIYTIDEDSDDAQLAFAQVFYFGE